MFAKCTPNSIPLLIVLKKLWQLIHNMGVNAPEFKSTEKYVTDKSDSITIDDDFNSDETAKNPFGKHFESVIRKLMQSGSTEESEEDLTEEHSLLHEANHSYCPEFVDFLKSYLKEMPLWSGMLLGLLERYHISSGRRDLKDYPHLSFKSENTKTECYVESVMRHPRQEDFPGR